eukprot:TRINITY_DN8573_c0_g1_i1.p1 TRINITY_DN8573_c0_g1~~TRINITY_DN8573_c0_g1_i1.p1  ORF type:complete len:2780 (-),score=471.16 TRINITY_DN8573_c0_g1_i1:3-8342(-)
MEQEDNLIHIILLVKAKLLTNVSEFNIHLMKDQTLTNKTTVLNCVKNMQSIQAAMNLALPFSEELYFIVYSCTIFLYDCCLVFMKGSHWKEAIFFVGWCILCLETSLPLLDAKFLFWRTRLYQAMCVCYENLGDILNARQVAQRLFNKVSFLRNVENSDVVPPPQSLQLALKQSLELSTLLCFKYQALTAATATEVVEVAKREKKPKDTPPSSNVLQLLHDFFPQSVANKVEAVCFALTIDALRIIKHNVHAIKSANFEARVSLFEVLEEYLHPFVADFFSRFAPDEVDTDAEVPARQLDSSSKGKRTKMKKEIEKMPDSITHLEEEVPLNVLLDYLRLTFSYERWDLFEKWHKIIQLVIDHGQFDDQAEYQLMKLEVVFLWEYWLMEHGHKEELIRFASFAMSFLTTHDGLFLAERPDMLEDAALQMYHLMTDVAHGRSFFSDSVLHAVVVILLEVKHPNVVFISNVALHVAKNYERQEKLEDSLEISARVVDVIREYRHAIIRNSLDSYQADGQPVNLDDRELTTSDSILYKTLYALHAALEALVFRLSMKIGVHIAHATLMRRHNKTLQQIAKREDMQHIYGGLSSKERKHAQSTRQLTVLPPEKYLGEERRLEERCGSNLYARVLLRVEQCSFRSIKEEREHLLLDAVQCVNEITATEESLRLRCGVPNTVEMATAESFPLPLLWGVIALKAFEVGCSSVAQSCAAKTLPMFVTRNPEKPLWEANPIATLDVNDIALQRTCTPLLQIVAQVMLATAEMNLPQVDAEEQDDLGLDRGLYALRQRQITCLRAGNYFLMALHVSCYINDASLIIAACNKLMNCLLTVLSQKHKPFVLLRPFAAIASVLPTVPEKYWTDPNLQFLGARVVFECLDFARRENNQALHAHFIKLFHQMLELVHRHPNRWQKRHLLRKRARAERDKPPLPSEIDAKPKDKPRSKKDERQPPSPHPPTEVVIGVEDFIPLEWYDLMEYCYFEGLGAAIEPQPALVPTIFPQLSRYFHSGSELLRGLTELQASFASHALYSKFVSQFVRKLVEFRHLDKATDLVSEALALMKARFISLVKQEREMVATIRGIELAPDDGGDQKVGKKEPKKGTSQKPKSKEKKKDGTAPPAEHIEGAAVRLQRTLLSIRAHYKFRRLRQDVTLQDVPRRAQLNTTLAAVSLARLLSEFQKPPKVRSSSARTRRGEEPRTTAKSTSPERKRETKEAKKPPSRGMDSARSKQGLEDNPETEGKHTAAIEKRVAIIRLLSRAVVLYHRIGKLKHAIAASTFMYNVTLLFFGKIAGDITLPGSAPAYLQQELGGGWAFNDVTSCLLQPGLRNECLRECSAAFRVAAESLLHVVYACSTGKDLRNYIPSLNTVEFTIYDRETSLHDSTCITFLMCPEGQRLHAELLEMDQRDVERQRQLQQSLTAQHAGTAIPTVQEQEATREVITANDDEVESGDEAAPKARVADPKGVAGKKARKKSSLASSVSMRRRKLVHDPSEAHEDIPWLVNLDDIALDAVIVQFCTYLHALQLADKAHNSVARYAEEMDILTKHHYAEHLIPLVIRSRTVLQLAVTSEQQLLQSITRDKPRVLESACVARIARLKYYWSRSNPTHPNPSLPRSPGYKELVGIYQASVSFLRSKASHMLTMQLLQEVGQVHADHGNFKEATTAWRDAVDVAFGVVNSCNNWRELVTAEAEVLLQKQGLWRLLLVVVLLGKLARACQDTQMDTSLEYAMFAAKLGRAVLRGCVGHPPRDCDFAGTEIEFLLSESDLFADPNKCNGLDLLRVTHYISWLLINSGHPLVALPTLSLCRYLAVFVIRSAHYAVHCGVLKVQALCQIGHFAAAYELLIKLFDGEKVPHRGFLQLHIFQQPLLADNEGRDAPKGKQKPEKQAKKGSLPTVPESAPVVEFSDCRDVEGNRPAIERLTQKTMALGTQEMYGSVLTPLVQMAAAFFLLSVAKADWSRAFVTPGEATKVEKPKTNPKEEGAKDTCAFALQAAEAWLCDILDTVPSDALSTADVYLSCEARYLRACIAFARGQCNKAVGLLTEILAAYDQSTKQGAPATEDVDSFVTDVSLLHCLRWFYTLCEALWEKRQLQACHGAVQQAQQLCQTHMLSYAKRHFDLLEVQLFVEYGKTDEAISALQPLLVQARAQHFGETFLPQLLSFSALLQQEMLVLANLADPENSDFLLSGQGPPIPVEGQLSEALLHLEKYGASVGFDPELPLDALPLHGRIYLPVQPLYIDVLLRLALVFFHRAELEKAEKLTQLALQLDRQSCISCPQPAIAAALLNGKIQRAKQSFPCVASDWGTAKLTKAGTFAFNPIEPAELKASAIGGAAEFFETAIQRNISIGIHDHQLCRAAFIELAWMYGSQQTPGKEVGHMLIACNCLLQAARADQQQRELFGSVLAFRDTSLDKADELPECVLDELREMHRRITVQQATFQQKQDSVSPSGLVGKEDRKEKDKEKPTAPNGPVSVHTLLHYYAKLMRGADQSPPPTRLLTKLARVRQFLQRHAPDAEREIFFATPPQIFSPTELRKGLICTQSYIFDLHRSAPTSQSGKPGGLQLPDIHFVFLLAPRGVSSDTTQAVVKKPRPKEDKRISSGTAARPSSAASSLPLLGALRVPQSSLHQLHACICTLKSRMFREDRGEEQALEAKIKAKDPKKREVTKSKELPLGPSAEQSLAVNELKSQVINGIVNLFLQAKRNATECELTQAKSSNSKGHKSRSTATQEGHIDLFELTAETATRHPVFTLEAAHIDILERTFDPFGGVKGFNEELCEWLASLVA